MSGPLHPKPKDCRVWGGLGLVLKPWSVGYRALLALASSLRHIRGSDQDLRQKHVVAQAGAATCAKLKKEQQSRTEKTLGQVWGFGVNHRSQTSQPSIP